jgi:O-antigen/teichoic acid export membrane protein
MSLTKRIFSGYLWSFLGQWVVRLTGLASTLILVRVLSPADFGLMALATLVVGFFDVVTQVGVDRYIFLQKNVDNNLLNSGWTINLLFRLLMVILIYLSSDYAAHYFNDLRLASVLKFICITQILSALKNIGMISYIKEGNFKPSTLLNIMSKILAMVVTIYFAITLKNYWCLVYGTLAFEVVNFIGSYYFSSYRPRLNFRFNRELFRFTSNMIFRSIAGFTRSKLDIFLVGNYGSSAVGKYSIALEFATLPLGEIVAPATMPVFSGIMQYKNDTALLYDKTFKYLSLVYLLIIPAIAGIFITAEQISYVVLGGKWVGIDNTIRLLAVFMLPFSLQGVLDILYDNARRSGTNSVTDVLSIVAILTGFYYFSLENLDEFVVARSAISLFIFFFMIVLAQVVINFSIKKMMTVLFIPCIATTVMLLSFHYLYINTELNIQGLLLNVCFGGLIYFIAGLFLLSILKNKSDLWHFCYSLVLHSLSKTLKKIKL